MFAYVYNIDFMSSTNNSIFIGEANGHINRWINAWDNHDLESVLSLYCENIEFSSPKINLLFPTLDGEIKNKDDLKKHFSMGYQIFQI